MNNDNGNYNGNFVIPVGPVALPNNKSVALCNN